LAAGRGAHRRNAPYNRQTNAAAGQYRPPLHHFGQLLPELAEVQKELIRRIVPKP
jgi:hypothetical protein